MMRFRGAILLGVEEFEPGTYQVLGRATPLTGRDIRELTAIHEGEARRSNVMVDDNEFIEFLGLRDDLKQLVDYYGGVSFLLQPWILQNPKSAHAVSCEQALGSISDASQRAFETEFGIGTDGKFVRKPSTDRKSVLVRVPFGEADSFIAAMLSDTYLFSSAALFSTTISEVAQVVVALSEARTIAEFRNAILAVFPTAYGYDVNEDEFRITTRDNVFVDRVMAALSRRIG